MLFVNNHDSDEPVRITWIDIFHLEGEGCYGPGGKFVSSQLIPKNGENSML